MRRINEREWKAIRYMVEWTWHYHREMIWSEGDLTELGSSKTMREIARRYKIRNRIFQRAIQAIRTSRPVARRSISLKRAKRK